MNAKQRWNSEHYQQINISVPKELASTFKLHCTTNSLTVAGEIARLMREALDLPSTVKKKEKPVAQRFDTRRYRRIAMKNIIVQLEEIKAAEEAYGGNIPEQLQDTNAAGIDDAISTIDTVIEELTGIEIYPEPPVRRKGAAAPKQSTKNCANRSCYDERLVAT